MKQTTAPSDPIPNVLAERYASPAMQEIWSAHGRILLERDFWIAVMKAQRDLGVAIPAACTHLTAWYARVNERPSAHWAVPEALMAQARAATGR